MDSRPGTVTLTVTITYMAQKKIEKIMVVYIELHLYSSNYPGDIVTSKQLLFQLNHIKKK